MINNVKFAYRNGTLITFVKDGHKDGVPYAEVKKIWETLTINSIDGWCWRAFNNMLAFVILLAQGQGGVLFVWDTDRKEIIHYSEASYCEDFLVIDDKIVTMHFVTNYETPYHIQLWVCKLGTKDIGAAGKRLHCKFPVSFDRNSSIEGRGLTLKGKTLFVDIGDHEYLYSDDVRAIEGQQPQPEYSFLYKEWETLLDSDKNALRGMIT